jgi:hypothetical protein
VNVAGRFTPPNAATEDVATHKEIMKCRSIKLVFLNYGAKVRKKIKIQTSINVFYVLLYK